MLKYFAKQVVNDWGETVYIPTALGYGVMIVIMAGLLIIALNLHKETKKTMRAKQLACSAAAMAIAIVASYLKVFEAPMGGSVTLCSMMFITLIGYWYGLKSGLMTGLAYGILQLIIDPYILSVPQLICDYLLAFGALGLAGLFKGKSNGMVLGYLTGVVGRFFFTFLSGILFFAYYAPEGMNAVLYSFLYNGAYIGLEVVITIIVMYLPPVRKGLKYIGNMAV